MKSQYTAYIIHTPIAAVGVGATIMGIGIDRILPNVSGFWFLIPGIILFCFGVAGIVNAVCRSKWWGTDIFNHFKKFFTKRHEVLSANMRNTSEGIDETGQHLSWNLVAKLHINTTKPITIVFSKCIAELGHDQYKDIKSNFTDIMLIEEEYKYNEVYVYEKLRELKVSQIVINKPSTVTLIAMFETLVWKPGDKESLKILFKLPVSEKNYKPIKVSVEMSRIGQGIDFATTT